MVFTMSGEQRDGNYRRRNVLLPLGKPVGTRKGWELGGSIAESLLLSKESKTYSHLSQKLWIKLVSGYNAQFQESGLQKSPFREQCVWPDCFSSLAPGLCFSWVGHE